MKLTFTKRTKTNQSSDKRSWLLSSRRSSSVSLDSTIEKKFWNFLKRKHKTPVEHHLESQSTIVIEEPIDNISLVIRKTEPLANLEPVEIQKSYERYRSEATIKQSELNLESPLESSKNVFTPRLKSHSKRSGKISPEFLNSPLRRPLTPTENSESWNSIILRPPPSPSLPPQILPLVTDSKSRTPEHTNNTSHSIQDSINAIFQKLIIDPTITAKIIYKSKSSKSTKVSLKNLKHLPLYEPLNFSSNLEVFEQDLLKKRTKRAWTSETQDSTRHFSIFSWMSTSLTLNALSLPSVVVPPQVVSHSHTRDHTHEREYTHEIELSSLGSFDLLS